jgi:hydroxymethylpyrimidine pyrophosphatase-like HAD family hydrolase
MAKIQGLSKKSIAVLGDMPSDVPMFRQAGLSIAMGNASDEVKRQADCVTDFNTAEGFAKAIRNYIIH